MLIRVSFIEFKRVYLVARLWRGGGARCCDHKNGCEETGTGFRGARKQIHTLSIGIF